MSSSTELLPNLRIGVKLDKALDIMGWMEPEELSWLAFEAARHSVVIEVGSYLGRSSRALGDNCAGTVYCVDHWNGPKEFEPQDQPFPPPLLYEMFLANTKSLRDSGRLIPIRGESLEVANGWSGPLADMVFIDASHDLQSVSDDIKAWSKVLKHGGLLCGHDAHWPGVSEARMILLPQHMTGIGSIWAVDNFQGLK